MWSLQARHLELEQAELQEQQKKARTSMSRFKVWGSARALRARLRDEKKVLGLRQGFRFRAFLTFG